MKILLCILFICCLSGCVTKTVTSDITSRSDLQLPMPIRIQPCVSRVGDKDGELSKNATEKFQKQIIAADEFILSVDSQYVLSCEVTGYIPGNAVKRWVFPGWGKTVGQISAMIQDDMTGEILVVAEGNATVSGGGLYTVGASDYIIPAAVEDVVRQLQSWIRAKSHGKN